MINVKSFSENKLSSNTTLECYDLKGVFPILLNCSVLGGGGFFSKGNLPSHLLKSLTSSAPSSASGSSAVDFS